MPDKIDRDAIRILVADVGYEEASRRTNIKAATIRQWAKRGKWNKTRIHSQEKALVTTVTAPSTAHVDILNERKQSSKLHLTKYLVDAGERAAESNGDLGIARKVKDVAHIHSAMYPEAQQHGNTVNLQLLASHSSIAINTDAS